MFMCTPVCYRPNSMHALSLYTSSHNTQFLAWLTTCQLTCPEVSISLSLWTNMQLCTASMINPKTNLLSSLKLAHKLPSTTYIHHAANSASHGLIPWLLALDACQVDSSTFNQILCISCQLVQNSLLLGIALVKRSSTYAFAKKGFHFWGQ